MSKFDVVTIGDAILDTFLSLEHASEFARLRKETDEICIKEGAKVLIDDAQFLLGGNASNVAVGLSRLGLQVGLFAELGDDEFSEKLIKALKSEHVDLSHTIHTRDAPSTFSVILNLLGDRVAFVRHVHREHKFDFSSLQTNWVYLTSFGKNWRHVYAQVAEMAKAKRIKLAFNPGSAQIHEGRESFADVLAVADILFINRDEAEIILHGKIPEKSLKETEQNLLFRIQRMGPKTVVMTDGENGAYCMTNASELLHQKALPTKIVEKTGAGDGFASGFLAAIFQGKEYQEALVWGAAESASVLEKVGGEAGLLTKEEMERKIQQ